MKTLFPSVALLLLASCTSIESSSVVGDITKNKLTSSEYTVVSIHGTGIFFDDVERSEYVGTLEGLTNSWTFEQLRYENVSQYEGEPLDQINKRTLFIDAAWKYAKILGSRPEEGTAYLRDGKHIAHLQCLSGDLVSAFPVEYSCLELWVYVDNNLVRTGSGQWAVSELIQFNDGKLYYNLNGQGWVYDLTRKTSRRVNAPVVGITSSWIVKKTTSSTGVQSYIVGNNLYPDTTTFVKIIWDDIYSIDRSHVPNETPTDISVSFKRNNQEFFTITFTGVAYDFSGVPEDHPLFGSAYQAAAKWRIGMAEFLNARSEPCIFKESSSTALFCLSWDGFFARILPDLGEDYVYYYNWNQITLDLKQLEREILTQVNATLPNRDGAIETIQPWFEGSKLSRVFVAFKHYPTIADGKVTTSVYSFGYDDISGLSGEPTLEFNRLSEGTFTSIEWVIPKQ